MAKALDPKNEREVDVCIMQLVDVAGGIGVWHRILHEMDERGYTEAEVDSAIEAFNKRNGWSG